MKKPPLHDRVLAILALQPMTQSDLARCLSCSYVAAAHIIQDMHEEGSVCIVGTSKRQPRGRPQRVWRLVVPAVGASSTGRVRSSGCLGIDKSITCA